MDTSKRRQLSSVQKRVLMISNWRDEGLMEEILSVAQEQRWSVADIRFLYRKSVRDFQPDGILCCHYPFPSDVRSLWRAGTPAVQTWNMPIVSRVKSPVMVASDPALVGKIAAEHFLARGLKHAVFCAMSISPEFMSSLVRQFKSTFSAGGGRCMEALRFPFRDREDRVRVFYDRFDTWLQSAQRPIGVLTSGDVLAGHIIAACQASGVSVPDEVAVLGIGNKLHICQMAPCGLSSVSLNNTGRGRSAALLLDRMMRGEKVAERQILIPPVGVMSRKSTDVFVVEDAAVGRALRFIADHLEKGISVDDVAAAAGLSRTSMERHFKRHLSRSVNQVLLRRRLERCRELLLSTDLPLEDIAPRVGVLSRSYLHRTFRKRYGCSPQEMRSRYRG